jgi:hypothetical protein
VSSTDGGSGVAKIPVDKLYHPGVVVRDAKATARNYAEIFGIDQWAVAHYSGNRLADATTHGLEANHSFTVAYGAHPSSGVTFQLVQPDPGDASSYTEFLCTRGEGIHNLCTSILPSADALPALIDWFAANGVEVGQSCTVDEIFDWYLFDTRKKLGGYYIQVVVPRADEWMSKVKFDDGWDFSAEIERPEGVTPLPLDKVYHFGVVVRDVVDSMTGYARLFGFDRVEFWDIGSAGAAARAPLPMVVLEQPTYYGNPVDHRIFNSLTEVADFGFEVIQTTVGPIHYKEDFLEPLGEGIHHLFPCMFDDEDTYERHDKWMTSIGAPIVQSGNPRRGDTVGLGEYFYWDTREKLGGYLLEGIIARPGFWEDMQLPRPTTFALDFTRVGA